LTLLFSFKNWQELAIILKMPNVRIAVAKKAKSMGISLPPELIRKAKKHAYSKDMSFSKYIRCLLLRDLKIDKS
jgi:predicted DNA binding CopG/RHH family protein